MNVEGDVLRAALERTAAEADLASRARLVAADLRQAGQLRELAALLEELCDELGHGRDRLITVGLDLHDDPLQDVAAAQVELHLFRRQLAAALTGHAEERRLVGRVDDLVSLFAEVGDHLRELVDTTRKPTLAGASLSQALEQVVEHYGSHCEIQMELDPGLDAAGLTNERQIALVHIVQSALANVVQHSGASQASVVVRCEGEKVKVEVVDRGRGFDIAEARRRATLDGRMGLHGMEERIRIVGGELEMESSAGRPTRIAVRLPTGDIKEIKEIR
jgi:signal transduction histidine kinase